MVYAVLIGVPDPSTPDSKVAPVLTVYYTPEGNDEKKKERTGFFLHQIFQQALFAARNAAGSTPPYVHWRLGRLNARAGILHLHMFRVQ